MEIKKEYQSIFDLVNQIISYTNELLHVVCFADALRIAQDQLDSKNFYAINPRLR